MEETVLLEILGQIEWKVVALILFAVIGATEIAKRVRDGEYWTAIIISIAGAFGALAGLALIGVTFEALFIGFAIGLAGSGLIKFGQVISGIRSNISLK